MAAERGLTETNQKNISNKIMIRGYKILTITHRNTKLNELSQYIIADECVKTGVANLKDELGLEELMYLATCNRVMYFFYTTQDLGSEFIDRFFNQVNPNFGKDASLLGNVVQLEGKQALSHLFEVASSMDSLVVGEREILRQLREAYQQSNKWGVTGDHIRVAMRAAVEGAKYVYSNTGIGEKPISVVSLAIQKVLRYNLPTSSRILLIGAGETNTLVAKFLVKHEFNNVVVFNRTLGNADRLAKVVSGQSFELSKISDYKEGFDCIIVCTGATKAILDISLYTHLLQGDNSEKLLVDLAIPNNVSKEVVRDFNVKYVEIEGLRALAKENVAFREGEVVKGKEMLAEKLKEFKSLFFQRQITKALRDVPNEIKAIKSHAMNNVFKREVEMLDDDTKELIARMMGYMEKRCISIPMEAAKNVVV